MIYATNRQATLSLGEMLNIARSNLEYARQTASNTSVLPKMAKDIERMAGGGNVLPSASGSDIGLTG
ncbi:hypothetical protein D9M68_694050 [compost metagenome]